MIWTRRSGLLGSVHQVNGHGLGAALFPISLVLCALLYWPLDPLIYQGAALILGLSDGLAGLVGQRLGQRAYRITGLKTLEGSAVFFFSTLLILAGLTLYVQKPLDLGAWGAISLVALGLTLVEGAVSKGWDNLPVSLLAGLAILLLL